MSCLEYYPRRQVCLCYGCKAWYCPDCMSDHTPCNDGSESAYERELKSEAEGDDNTLEEVIDDSKPGIWIVKVPQKEKFNIWDYMVDNVKKVA